MIHAKEIKIVPLSEIRLNPKNRNTHPKKQIDEIVKIIKYQGFRRPGTISNRSGLLVCGEGRFWAAKKMGLKSMPVMFQDYETEEQEYADGVADNALDKWAVLDLPSINLDLDSMPSLDIDLLGIKDFTKTNATEFEPQCDENEVPEVKESICKLGDVWTLGRHRLMCGDSLDVNCIDRLKDGAEIDLMFTDPPYGINAAKKGKVGADGGFGTTSQPAKIIKAKLYRPIIGDDKDYDPNHLFVVGAKSIICWGANYYADKLPVNGHWLVWDKKADIASDENTYSDCELAWTNISKTSVKIFRHLWSGLIRAGNRAEEMSARVHPTQKPVGLCGEIISKYSDTESNVLDLFGGSGSTLIACEKTNRKCFMMELDPHYCDVIVARWEKYTGKKGELINGKTTKTIRRSHDRKTSVDSLHK